MKHKHNRRPHNDRYILVASRYREMTYCIHDVAKIERKIEPKFATQFEHGKGVLSIRFSAQWSQLRAAVHICQRQCGRLKLNSCFLK